MTSIAPAEPQSELRRETIVIASIGGAHFASHCLQMALPTVLPLIAVALGVDYLALGAVLTVFYTVSAIGQVTAGVLVDRFGAHRLLMIGLVVQSVSVAAIGLVGDYVWLFPLAVTAGIGNTVYHPADLSILSRKIAKGRSGRAFAVHTASGSIGYAIWPVVVALTAAHFGWQAGVFLTGALGLCLAAVVAMALPLISVTPGSKPGTAGKPKPVGPTFLQIIRLPVVASGFAFFLVMAMSNSSVRSFGTATLFQTYGIALVNAAFMVSVFQGASTAGTMLGGFIADRVRYSHNIVAMVAIVGASLSMLVAWRFGATPWLMLLAFASAGIWNGIGSPSRDILVRRAAPEASMGKVFGAVYAGLDAGGVLAPLIYGYLLDHDAGGTIFLVAAIVLLVGLGPVAILGRTRPAN